MPETVNPLDAAVTESAESMERMATEFQALLDAERGAAQTNATPAPKQEAKPSASSGTKPMPSGKPDAPAPASTAKGVRSPDKAAVASVPKALVSNAQKPDAKGQAGGDSAVPSAPDFSDVPTEYAPGQTKGPQWKRLHEKADYYSAQAATYAEEINTLRKQVEETKASNAVTPAIQEQISALQKERDAYKTQLEAVAVERSPEFESRFKPRIEAAVNLAKAAVGPEEGEQLAQLLQQPDSAWKEQQLESILSRIPSQLRQTRFSTALAEIEKINAEKSAIVKNSTENFKTLQLRAQEDVTRMRQEQESKAMRNFESMSERWKPVGLTAEELEAAKTVYIGKDQNFDNAAEAALWFGARHRITATMDQQTARIAELESELKTLRSSQPGVRGSDGGQPATQEEDPTSTSYMDRIANEAVRQGIFQRR